MEISRKEKFSHLADLMALAKSDQSISKIEAVFVNKVAERLGVNKHELALIEFAGTERAIPKTEYQIIPLFHRLIIMMMVDGKNVQAEIDFCTALGLQMGLNLLAVNEVLTLAKKLEFEYLDPDRVSAIFKKYYN